ncbi:MAG: DUF3570 domain-containing protein [Candidatus Eisenbacteria bacterium]|nr:DUF3570 domain-containing protein [Candidatus Eisenbacteria bacterium]
MQVTRGTGLGFAAIALGALAASPAGAQVAVASTANGLFRTFVDSKHVLVRSFVEDFTVPLRGDGNVTLHWNHERVLIPGVAAPAGSEEAIDAITTASRPIEGNAFQDFIKVRNELEGQVSRGGASLGYYHSIESDYLGHQVSASYNRDVRDDQINISVGTSFGWDDIKPLVDQRGSTAPDHKNTLHVNAVATRVLSPVSVVRLGVEVNRVTGLQHNPYRMVYAGGTTMPERHPESRLRRDAFLKLHHYLANRSSLKFDYRLYDDDWGVLSHEVAGGLSQYITRGLYAQYEYRWYTQSSADFWRPEYATTQGVDGYVTGDYRMSPLSSHLFGFNLNADLGVLAPDSPKFRRFSVSLDYERYFNSNNYSADILETGLEFRF